MLGARRRAEPRVDCWQRPFFSSRWALRRRGGYFPNSRNRRRAEADGDKRGRGSLWREIGRKNRFRKWPFQRASASGLLEPQGEVARIGVVEKHPGALVEHVGIDAFGLEQQDAALPIGPFALERGKLGTEFRDLLVEVLLRAKPAVAGIGVDAEIADYQRGDGVKRERVEDGAEPLAGHHAATMPVQR